MGWSLLKLYLALLAMSIFRCNLNIIFIMRDMNYYNWIVKINNKSVLAKVIQELVTCNLKCSGNSFRSLFNGEALFFSPNAVEVENHLVQDSPGVGHLHTAGLALHKVVADGEHGAEILRSHSQDRLVGSNFPTVRANDPDIPELGVSLMSHNVSGDTIFMINQHDCWHDGIQLSWVLKLMLTGLDWRINDNLE